ncbi:hypothetical protein DE146DRAFT_376046 [Phaeosphaeria sp. MPI-PUGE-AT-0046c]|nr:hypothetical protein DE146DRAFT_376046 [Phaeosphaeria sp. MPI-PUGE-AT-0046c]
MDHLEDDLDLRYHRGLNPDVYYRCPTLESLDGALRNEIEKNASSLIPIEVVTEFIFAAASAITIPVAQQLALDALIKPADYLQSITVDYALCRDIDGKARLKVQRAIARSIVEVIQGADGYRYAERSAQSKEGGDGARFKYVCNDSLQNRDRKSNTKKDKEQDSDDGENVEKKRRRRSLPTYDCGGALHIKFSIKREAINVVYKHNPIHGSPAADESIPPPLAIDSNFAHVSSESAAANVTKARKRKGAQKDNIDIENDYGEPDFDTFAPPASTQVSAKKKRSKKATPEFPSTNRTLNPKTTEKTKQQASPSAIRKSQTPKATTPPQPIRDRACLRCREKKIKCDRAKPTCNQCRRGLWTCQYDVPGVRKRSRNGCINCKARKRKCTEEQPACAHCLRLDDDCEYAEYP